MITRPIRLSSGQLIGISFPASDPQIQTQFPNAISSEVPFTTMRLKYYLPSATNFGKVGTKKWYQDVAFLEKITYS